MTITVALPPRFIWDCIDCDCDVGDYDGRKLTANREQLIELRSRAKFYADDGTDYSPPGLVRSARALLKRLDALGL